MANREPNPLDTIDPAGAQWRDADAASAEPEIWDHGMVYAGREPGTRRIITHPDRNELLRLLGHQVDKQSESRQREADERQRIEERIADADGKLPALRDNADTRKAEADAALAELVAAVRADPVLKAWVAFRRAERRGGVARAKVKRWQWVRQHGLPVDRAPDFHELGRYPEGYVDALLRIAGDIEVEALAIDRNAERDPQ